MKKAAQCSCGRSAVKVNWPGRLSMSRHPGEGHRPRGPELQLPGRRLGSQSPPAPFPGSAARSALSLGSQSRQRGDRARLLSDRSLAKEIAPRRSRPTPARRSRSLAPSVQSPNLPASQTPAGCSDSLRARRYGCSPARSRFRLALKSWKGSWSAASCSWQGKWVSPEKFKG
jgi:hypothetical protein